MAEWVIEPLQPKHNRTDFCCGNAQLDSFIQTLASQYEKKRLGRTFVLTASYTVRVVGFYTLAAGSVGFSSLPDEIRKKLPRHPIPAIHLGRLAVDQTFRGQRLGEELLFHALRSTLELSERLGAFAVDVRAIDETARAFYQRYNFIALNDDPLHLLLLMKSIEAMFAQ